jgi:CAAX protease family protein
METPGAASSAAPYSNADSSKAIAPWWHTLVVLLALGTWAYFGKLRADHLRAAENVDRILMYLRTMCFEWLLLGFVLVGLWLRKAPFRAVLGERWRSVRTIAIDLGLGVLFLVFSVMISAVFISRGHGSADPAVRFLLPGTPAEKSLWILLSLTAGICEEAINRGYLQRQFSAWSRSATLGIILQALVFGACHAYQGFLRTIPITALGLLLGVLAQWRKTVRPGMITHFLQDALAIFVKR